MANQLCADCKHLKSKRVGEITWVYWCGISPRDKRTGEKLGVRPWLRKPHRKCPMREEEPK